MAHASYLAVLSLIVLASGWLEVVVRTRVLARWRRWLLAVLPVFTVFLVWDALAVRAGHWSFNPDRILGVVLPGALPLEELLFFLAVPTAGLLSLEAVRAVTGWTAGDET